ncbi:MAG: hypothetical protein VXW29_14600 [SAR324 cluster bacterium]|nr:hypothetical protein [SAR324 cluster bacterium]
MFFIQSDWGVLDHFQGIGEVALALKNFCSGGSSYHGAIARGDADFLETSIGMLLTVGAIFFHNKGSPLSLSEQLHQIPFPHHP